MEGAEGSHSQGQEAAGFVSPPALSALEATHTGPGSDTVAAVPVSRCLGLFMVSGGAEAVPSKLPPGWRLMLASPWVAADACLTLGGG